MRPTVDDSARMQRSSPRLSPIYPLRTVVLGAMPFDFEVSPRLGRSHLIPSEILTPDEIAGIFRGT